MNRLFLSSLIILLTLIGCSQVTIIRVEPMAKPVRTKKAIYSSSSHRVIRYPNAFLIKLSGVEIEFSFFLPVDDSLIDWNVSLKNGSSSSCIVKLLNKEHSLFRLYLGPGEFVRKKVVLSYQDNRLEPLRLEIKFDGKDYSIYYPGPYKFFSLQPVFPSSFDFSRKE